MARKVWSLNDPLIKYQPDLIKLLNDSDEIKKMVSSYVRFNRIIFCFVIGNYRSTSATPTKLSLLIFQLYPMSLLFCSCVKTLRWINI